MSNFNPNFFTLSTANFGNGYDGIFTLSLENGTNVVLTYTGTDTYTWRDVTGNFATGSNWLNGISPM